jgi:hypothetical protein
MTTALALAALFAAGEPITSDVSYDAITDQVRAVATLRAGDHRLEIGCTPYEVRRVWARLTSNRWFRPGNALTGNIAFTTRFDDERARRLGWSVRERTALLVGRGRVRTFVIKLMNARRLVIRVPGPEDRRYDIVFEIEGAAEAINRALDACGDPLLRRPGRWDWRLRLPWIRL